MKQWFGRFGLLRGSLNGNFGHYMLKLDMERFLTFGFITSSAQRQLILGYLSYFVLGSLLLCLPFMTVSGVSFIDNCFTAMSAMSTTGLASVDVATEYTFWGQLVILLLIQLGGLGYMTISTFVMYRVTHHFVGLRAKAFQAQYAFPESISGGNMVSNIIRYTFLFEAIGVVALYVVFRIYDVEQPLWSAVFHSVSAFCTAGFSIYSDNLIQFATNVPVNMIIMMLSYAGAMGFIVISDLWGKLTKPNYKITFTTRVIFVITLLVTVWGSLHLYFFEPSFAAFAPADRLMVSVFQTMSAMTTVGYNTVDLNVVMPISLFVLTVAMYVGASPSGTGGGLKSTTISAVYAYIRGRLRHQKQTTLANRNIPYYRVNDALTIFIFYTVILFVGTYLLTLTDAQSGEFLKLMFEAASALGTAGLSSGVCCVLTIPGKMILIGLMFIGRVGVLTIGSVMLFHLSKEKHESQNDDLAI